MASGAVTLDTVMLKIETDAGKAGSNIDNLAIKLNNLKSSLSGGFNNLKKLSASLNEFRDSTVGLGKIVDRLARLDEITDTLKDLSTIKAPSGLLAAINRLKDLGEVSGSLYTTSKRLSSIGKIVEPLQSLTTIGSPKGLINLVKGLDGLSTSVKNLDTIIEKVSKVPQLVAPLNSLGNIPNAKGFKNVIDNLGKLPELISKLDTTGVENFTRVCNELAQSLTPLAEKMQQVAEGYSAFSKIQNTFGKSASTATRYAKQQPKVLSSIASSAGRAISRITTLGVSLTSAFGKRGLNNLKKFHSKFKQVFLSLLGTRTLFTMIRKAVSEYEAFDATLQKFSTNVWRAFGAQLAPIIEYVMELFKQFVRVVYSVVYAITGIDLIARANAKAMSSWGKSAKDTLGSLQKFDDLNVVEFDKGKGDDNSLIEMDKIDLSPIQKIIDWVKQMKLEIQKALDTGQWYNVGVVFAKGINDGISFLLKNIDVIKNKLNDIVLDMTDALNGVINTVNWSNIGVLITESFKIIPDALTASLRNIEWNSIASAINSIFNSLEPDEIVHSLTGALSALGGGLLTVFLNINWASVAEKIGGALATFFSDISSILSRVPWSQIGEKVREAIDNVPWKDIWDNALSVFKSSFSGIGSFIDGALGTNGFGNIAVGAAGLLYVFNKLGGLSIFSNMSGVIKGFANATKTAGGLYDKVKLTFDLLGKGTLTTESISGVTGLSTGFTKAASGASSLVSSLGGLGPTIGIIAAVVAVIAALVVGFKELYETNTGFKETVDSLGESIGNTFGGIIETAKEMLSGLFKILKQLWEEVLVPVFDLLVEIGKPIIEAVIEVLKILWENILDPLVTLIETGLKFAWEQMCVAFEAAILVLGPVIDVLTWLWKNVLSPIVKFILDVVVDAIKLVTEYIKKRIEFITNVIEVLRSFLKTVWTKIKDTIGKIATWIYDKMISPLVEKFNNLKEKITEIWDNIWGGIKGVINSILGGVETFINNIIGGINKVIRKVENLEDFFEWLGFEVDIKEIAEVSIPKLATGTNEIPYEGLYHLHPGEAVVPKKYNPALGGGSNEETNARLDTLIALMNNMSTTTVVNIGNRKVYEGQARYNKQQQNKYGTINLY